MRLLGLLLALALCQCGVSPAIEVCPAGVDLLTWVYPVGSVELSQCNRVADISADHAASLRSTYQGAAKTVTLSANFQILAGSGRFELFAGKESSPVVSGKASGRLAVTGEVVGGFAPLAIWGLSETDAPMRLRVSEVLVK